MASGIIEKSNSGLFENEIEFNGKYATMVRYLRDDVKIFTTFREAYVISAIVGYLNKKSISNDNDEKVQPASIFPNELNKRKQDLRLIYRIVMLTEDNPNYSIEDYMNRAFRDDAENENLDKIKNNMATFNSYVCNGLEYLYNKFKDIDKVDDIINTLYEFVHDFIVDVGFSDDGEGELPDFNPDFD